MSFWSVCQVEPQREHTSRLLIMRAGFETYRPRVRIKSRVESLFPGYIFVRIIDRFYALKWTPGVVRILMAGEHPAHLEDSVVETLQKREVGGLVRLPKNFSSKLQPGQPVRIIRGSFEGHLATFQAMSGHERSRVLLALLGREVPVEIPVNDLVALNVAR